MNTSRAGSRSSWPLNQSRRLPQDVRAVLFDGVAGLFFRVMPWRLKKRCRPAIETATSILGEFGPQFLKRDVPVRFPQRQNVRRAFLDTMRAHVAALGLRLEVADLAHAAHAIGSPSTAQHQNGPPPPGSSSPSSIAAIKRFPQIHIF